MPKYLEQSCQACGWKFPGFHICLDLPRHIMERVEDGRKKETSDRTKSVPPSRQFDTVQGTPENRAAISAGVRRHHAGDPRRIERNKEIIRLYQDEDFTTREVANKLKIDQKTVMNVLQNARDNGDVVIRRAARRTGIR